MLSGSFTVTTTSCHTALLFSLLLLLSTAVIAAICGGSFVAFAEENHARGMGNYGGGFLAIWISIGPAIAMGVCSYLLFSAKVRSVSCSAFLGTSRRTCTYMYTFTTPATASQTYSCPCAGWSRAMAYDHRRIAQYRGNVNKCTCIATDTARV